MAEFAEKKKQIKAKVTEAAATAAEAVELKAEKAKKNKDKNERKKRKKKEAACGATSALDFAEEEDQGEGDTSDPHDTFPIYLCKRNLNSAKLAE